MDETAFIAIIGAGISGLSLAAIHAGHDEHSSVAILVGCADSGAGVAGVGTGTLEIEKRPQHKAATS